MKIEDGNLDGGMDDWKSAIECNSEVKEMIDEVDVSDMIALQNNLRVEDDW